MLPRFRSLIAVTFALTILAAFVIAPRATAESADSDDADAPDWVEEIIVTAEKRKENVLDVPLTMTAFSAQMMEELGMTRMDDLEQLVPGLQFGDQFSKKGQGTVIRGMGNLLNGVLQGNMAVATYVDGVYHTSQVGLADGFFDLERMEVARGPQGTLNGRNSIAGSISLYSKRPTPEWDVDFLTELTDQFSHRYGLAVGGPIDILSNIQGGTLEGAQLSFRLTGTYNDGDGAQENIGSGPDYDAPHAQSWKPQLRLQTERLDLIVAYSTLKDTGSTRVPMMLRQPPTDSSTVCFSWRDPYDPRSRDPDDPLFICNESGNNFGWYLYDTPLPSVANCPPNTPANRCEDVQNKVLANRPSIEDTFRDSWTVNLSFELTDSLSLFYTYGSTLLDQFSSNDSDGTSRVSSAQDAAVPQDCMNTRSLAECQALFQGFSDSRIMYPYMNDERSHELQLMSNNEGAFNFIVGIYDYTGNTQWNDGGHSFGHDWRFGTADERAQALGYADCDAFFAAVVAPQTTDPESWMAEETDFGRVIQCPLAGQSDFTNTWGSGAGSDQNTRAVFGSVDYEFNEQWAVSAGLRWTEDENIQTDGSDYFYFGACPSGVPECAEQGMQVPIWGFANIMQIQNLPAEAAADCTISCVGIKQVWDAVIYSGSVEYTPSNNAMIYGRISTGYRAGGLPSPTAGFLPPVEEETVINYEAGIKGLFRDGKLMLTAGVFLDNYDGYQVSAMMNAVAAGYPQAVNPYSGSPLSEFTTNVDGTSIYGFDLEWAMYLSDNLRFSGYYAFLDSKLGAFSTIIQDNPDPTIGYWTHLDWDTGEEKTSPYLQPDILTDGKLPQQAKHKGALTLAHTTELDDGKGSVQVLGTWSFTGDRYALVQNAESNKMLAYDRLDLRATWASADRGWSTTLYVQNVFDEIGFVEYVPGFRPDWAYNASEGYPSGLLTEPRQYGLQVRWKPVL